MTLSKNTVKFINSLRLKKFRQKYNNFIVEGDKMARELLAQKPGQLVALYALEPWLSATAEAGQLPPEKVVAVSPAELKKISSLNTPNQALAVAAIPEVDVAPEKVARSLSLYLDGIQDPGNFGTILRIADWFGITYIFCSPTCVDPYHPKTVQATMGAFLRVVCIERTIEALLLEFPQLPVYGAVMDGENVFRADLGGGEGVIVIGNEGNGISAHAGRFLTRRISIPPALNSRAESLNAAIAAGILCAVFQERGRGAQVRSSVFGVR